MMSLRKKIATAALAVGVAVLATPAVGYSAPNSLPAGTKVTGKLETGTKMVFVGTINGIKITVKCSSFTSSGKVPTKPGYKITLYTLPKISGCIDSLGSADTITTKAMTGQHWTLTENKTAPFTMALTIPIAGATFVSAALPSCVITAAPTVADPVTGSYNDATGTVTDTNSSIPTTGSGCTSGTSTVTATIVLTPNPGAPPF
jgi:hypothetical protein